MVWICRLSIFTWLFAPMLIVCSKLSFFCVEVIALGIHLMLQIADKESKHNTFHKRMFTALCFIAICDLLLKVITASSHAKATKFTSFLTRKEQSELSTLGILDGWYNYSGHIYINLCLVWKLDLKRTNRVTVCDLSLEKSVVYVKSIL